MTYQAILSHPAHCCVVLFLVSSHHICDTWAVMDMSCLLRGHYLMPPCCYYYHQTYEGSFKFRCGPQQCIEGNNGLLTHLPVDCAGRSSSKYQEDTETRDKEKASEATGRTPSVVGDLCLGLSGLLLNEGKWGGTHTRSSWTKDLLFASSTSSLIICSHQET